MLRFGDVVNAKVYAIARLSLCVAKKSRWSVFANRRGGTIHIGAPLRTSLTKTATIAGLRL
jgi:hypothetical protein